MTAKAAAAPAKPTPVPASDRNERRIQSGWLTIAGKELSDHILSSRFYVLLIVLGIAALIPLYFVADYIRSLAEAASGTPAVFLALFVIEPEGVDFGPISFTVQAFVAITAPLLGVAFGFDAVNGERHQGTLPRLLSQPIHRDDVINGKFAAGLIAISVALGALILFVVGFGLLRLGIAPSLEEIFRLISWFVLTVLYVGVWLAFGTLLSVVIRRAATSALVGFGVWLFVALPIAGPLLLAFLGRFLVAGATTQAEVYGTLQWLQRLLPGQLYAEASAALLSPRVTTVSSADPYVVSALPDASTILSFDQSLLLVWPHLVILFALMVGCFALAYARFMRQEVRA